MLSLGLWSLSWVHADSITRAGVRIHRIHQALPLPQTAVKNGNSTKSAAATHAPSAKPLPLAPVRQAPAPATVQPTPPPVQVAAPVASTPPPSPAHQPLSTRPISRYSAPAPAPVSRTVAPVPESAHAKVITKPVAPPPAPKPVAPPPAPKPVATPPAPKPVAPPPAPQKKRRRLPIAPVADGSTALPPVPGYLIATPAQQ